MLATLLTHLTERYETVELKYNNSAKTIRGVLAGKLSPLYNNHLMHTHMKQRKILGRLSLKLRHYRLLPLKLFQTFQQL